MSKKILIIDDDKEILFAMSAICEYRGWIPITAMNIKEAIDIFKVVNPDLVLIDYHLPVISGIEGVKKIRKINKTIPIIVLTVEEDQEVADKFSKVGASDFALKPVKAPDIISRIEVHLRYKDELNIEDSSEYIKGISQKTFDIIQQYMLKNNKYLSINNISKGTELAYQTVHRYLQYMEDQGKVEVLYKYGKIGRPSKRYKVKI